MTDFDKTTGASGTTARGIATPSETPPLVETHRDQSASDRPLVGIGYVVASMLAMTCLDAGAKFLVARYPVIEMLALRGLISVPVLLLFMGKAGGWAKLKTSNPWGQGRRIFYSLAAPLLFFTALREMPLADLTVMVFGSSFFMTALSVPLLGEKVGFFRWSAIAVGFSGVMVAAQPSGEISMLMTVYAIAASIAYAMLMIETRRIGYVDSIFTLTLYPVIGVTIVTSLAAPFVWVPIDLSDTPLFVAVAIFGLAGHFLINKAFTSAPVGTIAPFEYTALIWATIFGVVFFDELPGTQVWIGAAIIVSAGIAIVRREAMLNRSKKVDG
jgi:drug/metabolite transporter (DMT)-like permease